MLILTWLKSLWNSTEEEIAKKFNAASVHRIIFAFVAYTSAFAGTLLYFDAWQGWAGFRLLTCLILPVIVPYIVYEYGTGIAKTAVRN
jgi:hypothetical protein